MAKFEFFGVGRVVFGPGEFRRAGELAAGFGRKAMVLHNGPGHVDVLQGMLSATGVGCVTVRQRGEPVVGDVDAAADQARREQCDVVIGLGGGSAIDAAKAVAALLGNGGSALDYMEVVGLGRKITKPAAPWMAIATTAGTGTEATRNAVIGFPEKKFKASIRSELLLPRVALIDPELGVGVPPDTTARCGMDALCQLIESYTSTGAGPMTDALALAGIGLAARSLLRASTDGKDVAARSDMALAALWSGMTLTSAGLGAVHGFAAPLGANFPVPHGTVCAALLPHVMRANVAALGGFNHAGADDKYESMKTSLVRYATVGRRLLGKPELSDWQAIEDSVTLVSDWVAAMQIPRLSAFGMRASDVPEMVALARKASSMRYNPVVLSDDALAGVLTAAL